MSRKLNFPILCAGSVRSLTRRVSMGV